MTKNLFLDIMREIRHSFNRFVSILCIVAIGIAFFAGLRAAAPDMSFTIDKYFDDYHTMDLQVVSTLGLTDNDIKAIENLPGVEQVQPGYFTDAYVSVNGNELVLRLHSMPSDYRERDDYINQLRLAEGRLPQSANEMVVEHSVKVSNGLNVGDVVTLNTGSSSSMTGDPLHSNTFTVVGVVKTPYYLTFEKGTSQLDGKSIDLFAYTLADAFAYDGIYIEALVTLKGAREENAFTDAYKKIVDGTKITLTNIGADRSVIRGNEIRGMAQAALDDAQKKYDEGLALFQTEIGKAEQELQEAYEQLIKGDADLQNGKDTYNREIQNGEQKIADSKQQLYATNTMITTMQEQVASAKAQLDSIREQYSTALEASENYMNRMAQLEEFLADLSVQLKLAKEAAVIAAGTGAEGEYDDLINRYTRMIDATEREYQRVSRLNDALDATIGKILKALNETEAQFNEAQAQLDAAVLEYEYGWYLVEKGEEELAQQKAEGEKKLDAAEKELTDGWKEYNEGYAEFEKKRDESQKELDDAYVQLMEGKYQIERIENAEWFILDRNTNYGFVSYHSTVDRMKALSGIMPVFFILIAVLVCMTTMTRMVSEQRGVIGTYKALGYSDNVIASKYVIYVLIASSLGGLIGFFIGVKLFPMAVYGAWKVLFDQPPLEQNFRFWELVMSFSITVVVMVFTAYFTCRSELLSVPSELMRPKAPKIGKAIFLEKMPAIWSRLNFSQKVTMRNIFRYKERLYMALVGIMGCTALLVAGFGLNDTINGVVPNQYGKVFRQDLSVFVSEESNGEQIVQMLPQYGADAGRVGSTTVTISANGMSETVSTYVVEEPESIRRYIGLQNRASGKAIELDDFGIVITEKLAENMDIHVGDTVDVVDSNNFVKSIPVAGIAENYVFHYAYMTKTGFSDYFHTEVPMTELLIHCESPESKAALRSTLEDMDGITAVLDYSVAAESFEEQIGAMRSITLLIILCAMLLAFVVLYNLTNINVSERIREIATIKVLGFKPGEVAMYIYRENFIMTMMGAAVGLVLGFGLHRIVIKAIEQSNIMYGYRIAGLSFLWSYLLTCVFSVIVMIYMYPKLVNIEMVESLKSVE